MESVTEATVLKLMNQDRNITSMGYPDPRAKIITEKNLIKRLERYEAQDSGGSPCQRPQPPPPCPFDGYGVRVVFNTWKFRGFYSHYNANGISSIGLIPRGTSKKSLVGYGRQNTLEKPNQTFRYDAEDYVAFPMYLSGVCEVVWTFDSSLTGDVSLSSLLSL
ncbi:hypothetical protein BDV06DRAFT_227300 [Aspergillus oleicola]